MIQIAGPDGGIVQFPDGTDDETIKRVMRKSYGGAPAKAAEKPPSDEDLKSKVDYAARINAPDLFYDKLASRYGMTKQELFNRTGNPSTAGAKGNLERPLVAPGGFGAAATDIGRSALSGIGQGALAVAGLPGDIKSGVDWLMNKALPMSPEQQAQYAGSNALVPPSTAELRAGTERAIGPFYQPKSTAGQYAKSIGEFAPAAVTGPGGAVRKAAMAVAPGVATEAAQTATAGTPYEVPATIAAGILGGGLAAARPAATAARTLAKTIPDVEQGFESVVKQRRALYDQLQSSGLKYDSNAWDRFVVDTTAEIGQRYYRSRAPGAHAILDEMAQKMPTWNNIEQARQNAGDLVREAHLNPVDAGAANTIRRKIDNFMTSTASIMKPPGMSTAQAQTLMREARGMSLREHQAKDLMALRDAGSNYISGDMSGLMNQFSAFGRRIARGKEPGYSPEARRAIQQVYRPSSQLLEAVGRTGANIGQGMGRANLVPGGAATIAGYLGSHFGPVGTAAGVLGQQGVAMLAKRASIARTKAAAENAIRTVLAGPQGQSAVVKQRVQDLVRLLASQGINLDITANRPPRSLEFTVGPRQ
jgi:hypothetical protein